MSDDYQPDREVRFLAGVDPDEVDAYVRRLMSESEIAPSKYALPREYLSVSQVTMFQRCPRQYYFRYIENLVLPPGVAMAEGSAMHRALEHALHAKQQNDILPVDTLVDVFRARWKSEDEIVFDDEKGENENMIFARSRVFLSQYRQDFLPVIDPIEIEQRFVVSLVPGIPVVGFIDLIDRGEEDRIDTVVDHKVTGRMKSAHEVENDMQLTLYAHVKKLPKVRFDVFLKNKKPTIKSLSAVRKPGDIRWVQHVFREVAESITMGRFPPCDPKSYSCALKSCGYYHRCREAINV